MNIAIDKDPKGKYFVIDTDKNNEVSIKYEDEFHCLRQIKLRNNYKYDIHDMPVVRLYKGDEPMGKEEEIPKCYHTNVIPREWKASPESMWENRIEEIQDLNGEDITIALKERRWLEDWNMDKVRSWIWNIYFKK